MRHAIDLDTNRLQERRRLAHLRQERDHERRSLLLDLMKADRRSTQLRLWLDNTDHAQRPELEHMLEWARRQLSELEAVIDPVAVAQHLRERKLFPAVDDLHDPLGEPPARRPWGR